MADWNSAQYLKFAAQRTQPAIDLAARIGGLTPAKVIDIGCGPGNSTAILKAAFPHADILGVDNSQNMIETAQQEYPDLRWQVCDASKELTAMAREFDLVFSNACIQWIPDHPTLLKNMLALLKKGGTLAVQIPMNFEEPIHKIIGEVSASAKWENKFHNPRVFYTLTPSEYFDLLSEYSAEFNMWSTTYYHVMKSHSDILEWYRGTGMRPYLNVLNEQEKADFEQDVMEQVKQCYPAQKNGNIIFRFPRFFFTARV
jgi:trans-aconitate 2-methyltransferase